MELEKNVSVDDVKLMVAARLFIYFENYLFIPAPEYLDNVLFRQKIVVVDGTFKFKAVSAVSFKQPHLEPRKR